MTEKEIINEIYKEIENELESYYAIQFKLGDDIPELRHRIKGLDKARMIVLEISKKYEK